jgi:HK97 family phage prohead protease
MSTGHVKTGTKTVAQYYRVAGSGDTADFLAESYEIDETHDVADAGGVSVDRRTVFVDATLAKDIRSGKVVVPGMTPEQIIRQIARHEHDEISVLDGDNPVDVYDAAHEFGNVGEAIGVCAVIGSEDPYNAALADPVAACSVRFLANAETVNPPSTLWCGPHLDESDEDDTAILRILRAKDVADAFKASKKMLHYGVGDNECQTCVHFARIADRDGGVLGLCDIVCGLVRWDRHCDAWDDGDGDDDAGGADTDGDAGDADTRPPPPSPSSGRAGVGPFHQTGRTLSVIHSEKLQAYFSANSGKIAGIIGKTKFEALPFFDESAPGRPQPRKGTAFMPAILTPDAIVAAARAGKTARDLFFDESGARIAKAVGLAAGIEASQSLDPDRSAEFVISTGALDRYNSTIAVDGWHTDAYQANPVVLWAHDDSIPAIGRAANIRKDGGALRSSVTFAQPDDHPLADTIYRLVKGKFINAASVGWIPLKYSFVEGGDRGYGVDYEEQELLEWSVVNIPANPECLVGARSVGIDTRPLLVWAERTLDLGGLAAIPRPELEALRKAAGAPVVSRRARSPGGAERHPGTTDGNDTAAPPPLTIDAISKAMRDAVADVRAGRVLSGENADCLRAAHDCMQAASTAHETAAGHIAKACDLVRSVLDKNDPDDPDYDPADDGGNLDDDQQNAAEAAATAAAAARLRKAKALKLKAESGA